MPQRGEIHPEPAKVARARRTLGLSRKELASETDKRLSWAGAITEHTIAKMERGVSVDADRYWPVMVVLGLHTSPSLEGPGEDELPGAWLRDLRQSSGIAPERLCAASPMSEHDSPLSRTTLARIEQGTNRKPIRLGTLNKIAYAFEHSRVPLQASVLWTAWAEWQPESLTTWDQELPSHAPSAGLDFRGVSEALLVVARAADSLVHGVSDEKLRKRDETDPRFQRGVKGPTSLEQEFADWRARRLEPRSE